MTSSPIAKIKVILLEDDEDLREIIGMELRSRGFEVVEAAEPKCCPVYKDPGVACACTSACADILITDNKMPRMTGVEFIEHLAAGLCRMPACNKAVMSAGLSAADTERLCEMGCRVFEKPFPLAELHQWLDECVARIAAGSSRDDA
jgi:CheY-like chemotaxis protein